MIEPFSESLKSVKDRARLHFPDLGEHDLQFGYQ